MLLIALAQQHVRTAFDSFILGAFIGLGFQIVEDITYAMTSAGTQFGANQIGASVGTIILRMLTGWPLTSFTAPSSAPEWSTLSAGPPNRESRSGSGADRDTDAAARHLGFGGTIAGQNALLLIGLLIGTIIVALTIVSLVSKYTVTRERDFVPDVMAPSKPVGRHTR